MDHLIHIVRISMMGHDDNDVRFIFQSIRRYDLYSRTKYCRTMYMKKKMTKCIINSLLCFAIFEEWKNGKTKL